MSRYLTRQIQTKNLGVYSVTDYDLETLRGHNF